MVSLEDTDAILPLGALFLAGNSQEGRQFTGGEGGKQYLAGGFANASADWAVDEIRNAAGLDSSQVPDALAQAVLGMGLSKWGDPIPQNNAMARGIHYGVATESFENMGLTLGNLSDDVTTQNTGTTTPTQSVTPNNQTRRDNTVTY